MPWLPVVAAAAVVAWWYGTGAMDHRPVPTAPAIERVPATPPPASGEPTFLPGTDRQTHSDRHAAHASDAESGPPADQIWGAVRRYCPWPPVPSAWKVLDEPCLSAMDALRLDEQLDCDACGWREVLADPLETRQAVAEALDRPECRVLPSSDWPGETRPDLRQACAAEAMLRLASLQDKYVERLQTDWESVWTGSMAQVDRNFRQPGGVLPSRRKRPPGEGGSLLGSLPVPNGAARGLRVDPYETEKAWDFGVASDGSSFYVQEPLAGNGSRLLVRDLDVGVEAHVDLGTAYSANSAYDRGYSVAYGNEAREIVFKKGGDYGRGLYRFYSVAGDDPRTIRVGPAHPSMADAVPDIVVEDDAFMTNIVSSEEGYFAYPPAEFAETGTAEPWRIVRRRFGYGDEPGTTDEWSLDVELAGYGGGTMIRSDDGRWLGLKAWTFVLLDATTGEKVFEFPEVDKTAQLARLTSVLEDGATVADVGGVTSYSFRDGQLLVYRQIGSTRSCSGKAGRSLEGYYKCVADLRRRGLYRTVIDVFDLATIGMDSQPQFRVDFDDRNQCATGDFPLRGLQVHEGRLTFLTTRRGVAHALPDQRESPPAWDGN